MAEIQSLFQNSADTVVLTQLFSVLNESFKAKGGIYVVLKTLSIGVIKILASLVVQRLFKSSDASSIVRFIMFRLVYKKMILNTDNSRDILLIEEFKKLLQPSNSTTITNSINIREIPVYLEKEGISSIIYYLPYIHTNFIENLCKSAEKLDNNGVTTLCKDANGKLFTPLELFASKNYKKLERIVSNFFDVYSTTKMVTAPLVVLQSEAGLGKSHSAHYLANLNKYGEIRTIDLTSQGMVNRSFSAIVADIMSKKSTVTTVIYFDELDKYVSMYTRHAYSKQSSPENKNNSNMDEIVGSDFAVFEQAVKHSVLINITQLNNNFTSFEKGVIFIFCTNNFHTLFEGINQTHVDSIKSRFTFINFEKCEKDEFEEYVRVFNSKVQTPHIKYNEERLSAAINRVRDNLSITYRNIQISHARAAYDIDMLVEYVNADILNPLYSPSNIALDSKIPTLSTSTTFSTPIKMEEPVVEIETHQEQILSRNELKQKKEATVNAAFKVIKDLKIDDAECTKLVTELIKEDPVGISETLVTDDDDPEYYFNCILYMCCWYRRVSLLTYLISIGVDVNLKSYKNEYPLRYVYIEAPEGLPPTSASLYDCAELLIKAGAVPYYDEGKDPIGLLYFKNGVPDYDLHRISNIIDLMNEKNIFKHPKCSILHSIVLLKGGGDLIKKVVSIGVDVNGLYKGNTPLLHMCYYMGALSDIIPNIQTLLDLGANINATDRQHSTCLQIICCQYPSSLETIEYLLKSGIDKTLRSVDGNIIPITSITKYQNIIDLYNSY